jgi:hypothetical protein
VQLDQALTPPQRRQLCVDDRRVILMAHGLA